MSHTPRASSVTKGAKSTANSLRPHYYTSFQNYCCGPKANPKTPTTAAATTATTTTTTAAAAEAATTTTAAAAAIATTTTTATATATTNKDLLPIPEKFKKDAEKLITEIHRILIETRDPIERYTSVIPKAFTDKTDRWNIEKYLVDQTMFRTLKDAHIINWLSDFRPLHPIKTSGNGNCLLHAVLIAMIGIHDFSLFLRDQLAEFMKDNEHVLKSHWQTEKLKIDNGYGITSEDANVEQEWKELCASVHYKNSDDGQADTYFEFLEAVHIFSVSNMLRRPIIILSEDVIRNKLGEAISLNDLFGIYLPILSAATECVNYPIILAYDRSHFCPLQTNEIDNEKIWKKLLPLYLSCDHMHEERMLPIRFLGEDVSVEHSNQLLNTYLRIQTINVTYDQKRSPKRMLCAQMDGKDIPKQQNFFLLFYDYLWDFFDIEKPKAIREEQERERQRELQEHTARQISQDRLNRSTARNDPSPTRFTRTNATVLRDFTNHNTLQPNANNDELNLEGYVPSNGIMHIESSTNPPAAPKGAQSDTAHANGYYDDLKQQSSGYKLENISNVNSNGKMINHVSIPIQSNGSSSVRDQRSDPAIPIPVHIVNASSHSSRDMSLTIYEPDRDFRKQCMLCDRYFIAVNREALCPRCQSEITYNSPHQTTLYRPITRERVTNLYVPAYDSRSPSVISPIPKGRPLGRTFCPHCKNINLQQNYSSHSDYCCSVCNKPLRSTRHY